MITCHGYDNLRFNKQYTHKAMETENVLCTEKVVEIVLEILLKKIE